MKDFPGLTWLTYYRERLNADPELLVFGFREGPRIY